MKWYGKTIAPPTNPNLLYDTRRELEEFGVLWVDEVERVAALLVGQGTVGDHGRIHAALTPAIDRFWDLSEDDQQSFRDALNRFVRMYAFLSQTVAFTDAKLERDYLFCKALAAFVKPTGIGSIDLGSEVELTYLKMEQKSSGSLSLDATNGEVTTIFSGIGKQFHPDDELLSAIIDKLNERFGTNFAPEDRYFLDAVAEKLMGRADVQRAAAVNDADHFRIVLEKKFISGVVDQLDVAEDMAIKYLDSVELQQMVLAAYLPLIQRKAKVAYQEHCAIGELLGEGNESATLEYKSTVRTRANNGEVYKPLESSSLKTIAAFLNSREGGTLLIGVADDGSVHGLESDYASLRKARVLCPG